MRTDQLDKLKERLKKDLPGWEAQSVLSPVSTERYREPADHARKAGVNLLLFPDQDNELGLFYIKRPNNNPHDKHGGQISFPGGQMEDTDRNLIDTALRETEEEIGVPVESMQVLGQLSPLYVYVSNFYVEPLVSYIDHKPDLSLQKSEVHYVLTERLSYLLSSQALSTRDHKVRDFIMRDMPYYKLQNDILWGATAMITSEFMHIIREL